MSPWRITYKPLPARSQHWLVKFLRTLWNGM